MFALAFFYFQFKPFLFFFKLELENMLFSKDSLPFDLSLFEDMLVEFVELVQ